MNGELAALATIASFGTAWLRSGAPDPPPELTTSTSCFQYVRSLTVHLGLRGLLGRPRTATGTGSWLAELRRRRVQRIEVLTGRSPGPLPAAVGSAFANGGGWSLLATGGDRASVWTITWSVGAPNAPDNRIRDLVAHGVDVPGGPLPQPDLRPVAVNLAAALETTEAFCTRVGLDAWAPHFQKARALLGDPTPVPPYHSDLLPADASLERRRLAAAAAQAWVFGGMGSWNDLWLPDESDQADYQRITTQLYNAVLTAVTAAANARS